MRKVLSSLLLPLLFSFSSFTSGQTQTIVEIVAADTELSTLNAAFSAAAIGDLLSFFNFTLFAPTDDAFATLDQAILSNYLEPAWMIHLQYLLFNHLLFNKVLLSTHVINGIQVRSFLLDIWT